MKHDIRTLCVATLVLTTISACAGTPEIRYVAPEAGASAIPDTSPVALESHDPISPDAMISASNPVGGGWSERADPVRSREAVASLGFFQEETPPDAAPDEPGLAESAVTDKNDKSGTNPINFQRDLRIYNEYLQLNTAGDGNQNLTTLEFRTPFAGGKWQFRTRIPYSVLNADLSGDGTDDIDDSGLGDINFRLMTVPVLKGANGFAVGLEAFLNTASEDSLGAGTTSLAPVVFYGRFFKGGFGPWKKGRSFCAGTAVQVQR